MLKKFPGGSPCKIYVLSHRDRHFMTLRNLDIWLVKSLDFDWSIVRLKVKCDPPVLQAFSVPYIKCNLSYYESSKMEIAKMILRVGTRCSTFLLLWPYSRVIQHNSLKSRRYLGTGMTRILRCARFFSTDDQTTKGQHLAQAESDREGSMVARSGSNYSALLDSAKNKSQLSNREQFGLVLKEFMSREKYRKGHVMFINMALERMEEFSLEKDLLTYNRLLDVFPKGRYHPKRLLDALWPRSLPQIELALELLTRMEDNGVWPDAATYSLLIEVFGKHSLPVEKCERMLYWYDRYKDVDPYWIDGEMPSEEMELAKLALQRIVKNAGSITEHEVQYTSQ